MTTAPRAHWGSWQPSSLAVAATAALLTAGTLGIATAGPEMQRVWILLVLAPLAEEILFRAGIQEALLRRLSSRLLSNVLTAAAFALSHALAYRSMAGLLVFVPALLLGAVYSRWRRLRICVALHAAMNALWLAWSLMAPRTINGQ